MGNQHLLGAGRGQAWGGGHPDRRCGAVGLLTPRESLRECTRRSPPFGRAGGAGGLVLSGSLSDPLAPHPALLSPSLGLWLGLPEPPGVHASFLSLRSCELGWGWGASADVEPEIESEGKCVCFFPPSLCSDPVKDYIQANPGWYWAS